jgi:3',5'-nucleoside bisphosphate phosphatase
MWADLHNHSCLSPCASLEMSPLRLAADAAAKGVGLLGLTDHNSARNAPAFREACRRVGIVPWFGLEVTTSEECHVLALFDNVASALRMDQWVMAALPPVPLDIDLFGDQPVVDADGAIVELIDRLLVSAIARSLDAVRAQTHRLGGLFVPSHLNRPSFSIESQLGFLPAGAYDAIEVLPRALAAYRRRYPALPVITASDAHRVEEIATAPFRFEPAGTDTASVRRALSALAHA